MRLLLLGGTLFLGRHVADVARERGHSVTVFHRGTRPAHRPDLDERLGDRDPDRGAGLSALEGEWDAVIDTSGYLPRHVRGSADLAQRHGVSSYVFVSSLNAYRALPAGLDEEAEIHEPIEADEVTGATYGPLKVGCEYAVADRFGERATTVRAGLIVGPHDATNRFTYWCTRIADGGDVLAPDVPDQPVQVVDVRDLAEFLVNVAERPRGGVVNVAGARGTLTFRTLLERIRELSGSNARITWVDGDRLEAAGVQPWAELPLWAPARFEAPGIMDSDDTRARNWGATFRTIDDTIRDTLAWARVSPPAPGLDAFMKVPPAGLDRAREAALLASLG